MNVQTNSISVENVWDPYPTIQEVKEYDEISTVQQLWAFKTLEQCPFLENAEKVLDVGCGSGIVTSSLARRIKQGNVTGLDVSKKMIELAKQKFDSQNSKLDFLVGNAMALPFSDSKFDVVTSFNSLHWLSDAEKGLKEFYRVLKTEGRVVIVVPDTSPHSSTLSQKVGRGVASVFQTQKWGERLSKFPRGQRYTIDTLNESLKGVGFKNIEVKLVWHKSEFTDRKEFEKWMYASFTSVKRLSRENERWELVKELADKFLEVFPPEKDGQIKLVGPKLQAIAYK